MDVLKWFLNVLLGGNKAIIFVTVGAMIFIVVCIGIYALLKFPKTKITKQTYFTLIGLGVCAGTGCGIWTEFVLSDDLMMRYLSHISYGLTIGFGFGLFYFMPSFFGRKKQKYVLLWLLNSTAIFTGMVTYIIAGVWAGTGKESEKMPN